MAASSVRAIIARTEIDDQKITKCMEGANQLARKYIRLMADYGCQYLWDEYGAVNQETFPLRQELKKRLLAWAEIYHASLNMQDPKKSEA
jgi:hypothetical protein